MPIVLGVDIGTTAAKCLAVAEDGRALAFARHPYPMNRVDEDWVEQDPEDFYQALAAVVRKCVGDCTSMGRPASDIRAVALSAQADTLIIADEAGNALRPAISWMARAPDECRKMLDGFGAGFWQEHAGQPLTPYSSACRIRRLQRQEHALMALRPRIAYVPDFLAHRLTGRWVNDVPSASWSPFFAPHRRSPSIQVMEAVGISPEQVSPTLESGEPIGEFLPEQCDALGLPQGAVLIAGAFDQTAAAHGAGATAGGTSVLSCGTAWVLYAVTDRPPVAANPASRTLCCCCHVRPHEWGLVLPYTGGSAYDWVTRTVVQGTSASEASPVIFVPHLYGGLSPDWQEQSKGSVLGLTLAHTAQDICVALMRGLAFETRRNIEAAAPHAGRPRSLRMVGGATYSDIWPQIIADTVGCTVEVAAFAEAACYGAARIAAGSVADKWAWQAEADTRVCEPDETGVVRMDRLYGEYLAAYAWLTRHYRGEHAPATEDGL